MVLLKEGIQSDVQRGVGCTPVTFADLQQTSEPIQPKQNIIIVQKAHTDMLRRHYKKNTKRGVGKLTNRLYGVKKNASKQNTSNIKQIN